MRASLALMAVLCGFLPAPAATLAPPPLQAVAGVSAKGVPIRTFTYGRGADVTLLLAGFHGDEPSGPALLERFRGELEAHPEWTLGRTVVVVPVVNPDGLARGTRANARGVDVNRNFPTRNWSRVVGGPGPASEPETQAVMRLVDGVKPDRIVSVHAPLGEVNYDGPAADLARFMAGVSGLPATADIGYPTPGSFGTYAGKERRIPTITLELETAEDGGASATYRSALLAALFFFD